MVVVVVAGTNINVHMQASLQVNIKSNTPTV